MIKRFSPAYWNLIWELGFSGIKLRYKNSVFGFFWNVGKPLMLMGVLWVISTHVLRFDLPNASLYLLMGVMTWGFFVEATTLLNTAIIRKEGLVDKVAFPREALILGDILMVSMTFLLNLCVFVFFCLVSGVYPSAHWAFFIIPWTCLILFVLGIGFFFSAWMARFRDLQHIWDILVQVWFWATPVFYDASRLPENIRPFYHLSPVTRIMTQFRASFLPDPDRIFPGALSFDYTWPTVAVSVVVFVIGLTVFMKRSPYLAEEL